MRVIVITISPRSQNKYGGIWERKKGGQYLCRIYMYQRTLVCVPKYYRLTFVTICYHTFIHNKNTWFFNFILTFLFEIENTLKITMSNLGQTILECGLFLYEKISSTFTRIISLSFWIESIKNSESCNSWKEWCHIFKHMKY